MRQMGKTRTSGVLVKVHSWNNQPLSIPYLGVEVAADTVAVAKEETV